LKNGITNKKSIQTVTRIGHYTPFALLGAAIATTGAGLLILLTPSTPTYAWVLIQLTLGIGRGLNVQMPLIAAQHNAPHSQNAIATALVVLAQNLGPAIFLSLAQVIFSSGLESELARHAPGVDVAEIVRAGAAGVGDLGFREDVLGNVLEGYCEAIVRVMYLATAASAASLVVAMGMGWGSIKVEAADAEGRDRTRGMKEGLGKIRRLVDSLMVKKSTKRRDRRGLDCGSVCMSNVFGNIPFSW
jgi:hypothetical protein